MKPKETLLVFSAIVVALGIAEAVLRSFVPRTSYFVATDVVSISMRGAPEKGHQGGLYLATPSGIRLRPNARGIIRSHSVSGEDILLRTNSRGFRGREVTDSPAPRILFLGDSITLADYLPEEETFVARIEKLSKTSGTPWQTLNAGVGSVGAATEYVILHEQIPSLKPSAVVFNLYLNDVWSSPAITLLDLPKILRGSFLAQHVYQGLSTLTYLFGRSDEARVSRKDWNTWRHEVQTLYPASRGDFRKDRQAFNQLIVDSFRDWGSAWSPGAIHSILMTIGKMKSDCERFRSQLLVAIHPVRYQVETEFLADEPQQMIANSLKKAAIPNLNLLPVLRNAWTQSKVALFFDQCHHTRHGSQVVAQAMFQRIRHLSFR